MKRNLIAAALAAAFFAAPAAAQQQSTQRGMMGGGGGEGMMGQSATGGPARGGMEEMMGGGSAGRGGTGSGMMGGGTEGSGSGSGMTGGMMGAGMTGSGMMGGGMGAGMGHGASLADLGLTEEQAKQARAIRDETRKKQWELMGRMMEQESRIGEAFGAQGTDRAAAEKAFKEMNALREQMFAARLDAQQKFEALLTPEQRAKLRSRTGGGMM